MVTLQLELTNYSDTHITTVKCHQPRLAAGFGLLGKGGGLPFPGLADSGGGDGFRGSGGPFDANCLEKEEKNQINTIAHAKF